ncbi:MAG: hypothetical protein AAGC55_17750 [Myxococcota bacterium]
MKRCPDAAEIAAIHDSFAGAWRGLGARCVPDFAEIVARYSEPHRAYHTLEHLRACLHWLAATRELAEHPPAVELALVYHDIVYDPRRTDNEKRSAELFTAHARASQLPQAPIERIVRLIEGTASHSAHDRDGALLNDIDLTILGAPPHLYARYEEQIREEYRHVDERLFRAGRERILRSFLATTAIYSTPFFSKRLETQARSNLSRALVALR